MDQKSGFAEQMPSSIGRYQVQGSIGFGAMGAVYKAFDPLIKRTLAIKTIRLDIPRNSPQYKSFIERFYHEARISGTLSHPNIVTLFDIGEEGGIPYLAMEFVEGDTISSQIEKGVRFPPEKVISVISQAASAIDYAHTKGVIHRDIKPSNMMLSEGDRVKVTDFGIAKLVDAEMTQSGTLLGTPSYMSPEQAMGDKLDGRSDIFSLGVCAFEMLCGEQPFPGTNVTSILYKLVHVDPIEPANLEMNGLVPQKWHEVFSKVLAKKPDDRYQTAAEFVQDLEYCLGSWFGAVSESTIDPTMGIGAMSVAPDAAKATTPKPEAPKPAAPKPEGPKPSPTPVAPVEEVTAAIPVRELQAAASAATTAQPVPPPPPRPQAPPPAPSSAPPAGHPGATLPPTPRPAAPPPEPEEADLPATVHMKAPEERDMATVMMSASDIPDVTMKVPVKPAAPTPTPPPPPPTPAVPPPPAAKPAAAPKPAPPVARPAPAAPTTQLPTPPQTVTAKTPVPARKGGLSPVLVLAGAALFFFLAVGVAVFVWMRPRGATLEPPATTLAAAVEPTPVAPPPTTTPVTATATGSIHVETTPPGAAISINGEPKGNAPLDVADLAVGNYEVRAELRGYEPTSETVAVVAGTANVPVKLGLTRVAPVTGSVEIVSEPAGAAISVDGNPAGQAPLPALRLKPGSHKVDAAKEGFEPWSGSVTVEAGKKARVLAELKAIVKATPPPTPKPDVVDTSRIYVNAPSEVDDVAKKISGPSVSYPGGAPRLKSGDSVSVSVAIIVDENGDVQDAKITESAGKTIDDAVLAAIRKWRYTPATKQGIKVKVKIGFKQTFRAG